MTPGIVLLTIFVHAIALSTGRATSPLTHAKDLFQKAVNIVDRLSSPSPDSGCIIAGIQSMSFHRYTPPDKHALNREPGTPEEGNASLAIA